MVNLYTWLILGEDLSLYEEFRFEIRYFRADVMLYKNIASTLVELANLSNASLIDYYLRVLNRPFI